MATQLGPYRFVTMQPTPQKAREHVQVESRPGVAGVGIWKTGVRGQQYTVETIADMPNWLTACAQSVAYANAVGAGPLPLLVGNVLWGNVCVLEVNAKPEPCFGHGGLNGQSSALVRAQWKLIAV